MKSTISILIIMLLLLTPPIANAGVFYCTDGDTTCLIDAINTSNANDQKDTIYLTKHGTYTLTTSDALGGSQGPTGLPSITSEIRIYGKGSTIQRSTAEGTPDFRIMHVASSGKLKLKDVVIKNGRATAADIRSGRNCGGIMTLRGSSLYIHKSVISNNYADFLGGGVCIAKGVIKDSTISNNVSATNAGGITHGAIESGGKDKVDIINSIISDNTAIAYAGGGIFNGNGGAINIVGSTITGNTGTVGGGIANISIGSDTDYGTMLTIKDSVISGNFGGFGGGIYNNIGEVVVTNSLITNNSSNNNGAGIGNTRVGKLIVNDSCIFDNFAAITSVFNSNPVPNIPTPVMDARNNWWGASDGPSGVGPGSGDSVSTNIDFIPFLTSLVPACMREISIDIKPGNKHNVVNPRSKGGIWVAVLSETNHESPFDPSSQVDIPTVEFGPDGAKAIRHKVKDINKDGIGDLLLRFKIPDTGIEYGDTEATLTGKTFDNQLFTGTDFIKTVGCKPKKHNKKEHHDHAHKVH